MTQEDQTVQPPASPDAAHTVTAYQGANVRDIPYVRGQKVSYVVAGDSYPAACWTTGQSITDHGITNNVWIRLLLRSGGIGYVGAVYLKGDKYANLPSSARC